jgi:hypothetical protein
MKINKFLVAALATTTLFASCAKETEPNVGEDKNVKVSITSEGTVETRATGAQVTNGAAVAFTSGYLVFANGDLITQVLTISNGDANFVEGTSVGIDKLKATAGGQVITGVPGSSDKVYLFGNTTQTPAVGTGVSTYKQNVASQKATDGGVGNVSLYGGATLSLVAGGTATEFEATFDVTAIAARFEIKAITGTALNSTATGTLSYDVTGIFIDSYYNEMTLQGTGSLDLKVNGSTPANYADNATTTGSSYLTAVKGAVYDYGAPLADEATTAPTSGVWAYNLLAPASSLPPAMPAIVIKLENVTLGSTNHGTRFLTISKFYSDADTKLVPIDYLEGGHVYVIENIAFNEDDMTETPFEGTISAKIKVTLLPWESATIGWDFN